MKITFVLVVVLIITGSVLFYWFQWRPTKIRHDCSWVKKHSDAIPAKQGLTEEQLRAKGMLKTCPQFITHSEYGLKGFLQTREENKCFYENEAIIERNKSQKYVPAKDWWVKASKEEYEFCLHDKGLK